MIVVPIKANATYRGEFGVGVPCSLWGCAAGDGSSTGSDQQVCSRLQINTTNSAGGNRLRVKGMQGTGTQQSLLLRPLMEAGHCTACRQTFDRA